MALNMTLYNIFASPLMYVIISDIDVSVQSTISTTVTATFLEKSRTKRFQCGYRDQHLGEFLNLKI